MYLLTDTDISITRKKKHFQQNHKNPRTFLVGKKKLMTKTYIIQQHQITNRN